MESLNGKFKDQHIFIVTYVDCHGLIVSSSGPPNKTSFFKVKKFFFLCSATMEKVLMCQWKIYITYLQDMSINRT